MYLLGLFISIFFESMLLMEQGSFVMDLSEVLFFSHYNFFPE